MSEGVSSNDRLPPMTPREKRMYEQEYRHGAQLFQKALQSYVKSNNPYQQKEFQEVMDKAMRVLDETAKELGRQVLSEQNLKIQKDYQNFSQHAGDRAAFEKLNQDLDQAKKLT